MSAGDRRDFLKRSAAAVSAVGLSACGAAAGEPGDGAASAGDRAHDPVVLAAMAEAVLPGELGPDGRATATGAFVEWLAGFEPVAERPHPYLTPEITYGPPDPAPGWNAQLAALELEALRRQGRPFAELELGERRSLVRRQLGADGPELPDPARARHVAVGLLAHFYESAAANDLCHGTRIGKNTCRGLEVLEGGQPPERLGRAPERERPATGGGRPWRA